MAKAEASVEELVGMIERSELRLPEMQRRYVWRSTRVRDLLDSLYRGYTAREADDIANLSFIGGKTNRAISDKAPIEYLPEYIAKRGQAAFDAQCIPTSSALLGVEAYKSFLLDRRKRIAERLNAFLGNPT